MENDAFGGKRRTGSVQYIRWAVMEETRAPPHIVFIFLANAVLLDVTVEEVGDERRETVADKQREG